MTREWSIYGVTLASYRDSMLLEARKHVSRMSVYVHHVRGSFKVSNNRKLLPLQVGSPTLEHRCKLVVFCELAVSIIALVSNRPVQ